MLAERIAQLAAREGLSLRAATELARLGGVRNTVRVQRSVPVILTHRAERQQRDLGISLVQHLNANPVFGRIGVKRQGTLLARTRDANADRERSENDELRPLLDRKDVTDCTLWAQTSAVNVGFVHADDGLLVVDLKPRDRKPQGVMLLAEWTSNRTERFDATALFQVVATAQHVETLERAKGNDQWFVERYRLYLDQVREYLRNAVPEQGYELDSTQPLRLASDDGWGRAFSTPGTRLRFLGQHLPPLEVVELSDDGELLTIQPLHSANEGVAPAEHGRVTVQPNTAAIDRMREALDILGKAIEPAHALLLDALLRPDVLQDFAPATWSPAHLGPVTIESQRQHDAVEMALSCPDLCLIHGPPGTGKTTVICELVLQLARRGQRVLLVAPTHVALDNVLERIGAHPSIVALRLGDPANVDERVLEYTVGNLSTTLTRRLTTALDAALAGSDPDDAVVSAQARWRDALQTGRDAAKSLLLLNANVVCATPIGIGMVPEFRSPEPVFDVMIMDEASKATITDFLVPATRAKRWILVGDHHQLPPYVDNDELSAVVRRRAVRWLRTEIDESWASEMAGIVNRHFQQRMHPDPDAAPRVWRRVVERVVEASDDDQPASIVEELLAIGADVDALRKLAARAPQYEPVAKLLAELADIAKVSLPSAFEELADALRSRPERSVRLEYQHRMHPRLAAFSGEVVYGGHYLSAERMAARGLEIDMLESASIWIDTAQVPPEERYEHPRDQEWMGGGYFNPLEAKICREVVERCINWAARSWNGTAEDPAQPLTIGVVTFYVSQALHLRRALSSLTQRVGRWRGQSLTRAANGTPIDLHISITDRFQGQEKDIVILSGTRSNPRGRRGHTDNINRLNVALTRARHKRIFVGDSNTLTRNRTDQAGPPDLFSALRDHSEIKHRWGKAISKAMQRRPRGPRAR